MQHGSLEFYFESNPYISGHRLDIVHRVGDRIAIANPVEFTAQEPGEMRPVTPAMTLPRESLQGLLDALWGLGLRPSGHGGEPETTALQGHLRDMRAIAFKQLGMEEC